MRRALALTNNGRVTFRKMPPLHALAAFEAAARLKSFGKAAQELCLTQSAVSHRIRLLEKHLQTRLFLRLSKQVALTPKGEAFLVTVREALVRLHEASASLRENARRLVRVSVLPAFASNWLIQRVGEFYRRHPDIDLEIHTTAQLANLKAGEADIGVRFGPRPSAELVAHQLFVEYMFPVASPAYLEAFGRICEPQDLKDAVLLRNPRLPWRRWFDAAGLGWPEPAAGPVFSDVGFMLEAAASGQGVALARSSLAQDALAAGQLVRVARVVTPSDWNFFLVHLPGGESRPELAAFSRWILDTARHAPPPVQAREAVRAGGIGREVLHE